MAKSYDRLVTQIKKLQRQADRLAKKRGGAISRVNTLIDKFGIAATELMFGAKRGAKRGVKKAKAKVRKKFKVAPKYRGPGGMTWSGRGLMPVWLRQAIAKGRKREDFLIKRA